LKRFVFFPILAAFLCVSLRNAPAQVTVENTITTDSVNLFSADTSALRKKSPAIAMGASLLLPGLGHQYIGRERTALAYYTVEAASIFAVFFCKHYADKVALDAAGYAWVHAGALGSISDVDDSYWRIVGNSMDIDQYNAIMDLNRSPEKKITNEAQAWHWDDQSSQNRFNQIRSTSRTFRIASSFFIGALVLDRVVAFIDIRSTTRNKGIQNAGIFPPNLQPMVSVTARSVDLSFVGSF
jgi:hypothetical protein